MRQLVAFIKKEFLELVRTGKVYILLILFVIFGIMNPAIAKLTPWMMEMFSESLKEQGMSITPMEVTAMTSWQQYFKNMSMEFIVIIVMFYNIVAHEIQKGTLINMLTKGLSRWKVIMSKAIIAATSWSLCYWLCFGITYGYNAYFWDNSIADNIGVAALGSYIFGLWLISLIILTSAFMASGTGVLLSTGGAYVLVSLISAIPDASAYMPSMLTSGMELISSSSAVSDYALAFIITGMLIILNLAFGVAGFNRKKI